jgi:hypothetical protein
MDIVGGEITQFLKLLDHRRDDQIDDPRNDGDDDNQREDNTQGSWQMQLVVGEFYHRVKQLGEKPSNEKR